MILTIGTLKRRDNMFIRFYSQSESFHCIMENMSKYLRIRLKPGIPRKSP